PLSPTNKFILELFSVTPVTATVLISSVNSLLWEPPLLVTVTVKVNVPASVGVPEITPVLLSKDRPSGRESPVTLHSVGELSAVRVSVYAVPTVPSGRDAVVMLGGTLPPIVPVRLPELLMVPFVFS